MSKLKLFTGVALAALMVAPAAKAGNLYAFGDSLSDNGNLWQQFKIPPQSGVPVVSTTGTTDSYGGRYSNGPVWVEDLGAMIGRNFSAGNDYAYGGAFTGNLVINGTNYGDNLDDSSSPDSPSLPGINDEIKNFAASGGSFGPSDIVTLWGGANNYFAYSSVAVELFANNEQAKAAALLQTGIRTTLTQILEDTTELTALGARMLIVPNLPDLGDTPLYLDTPGQALATEISTAHDEALPSLMQALHEATGANIIVLNTEALLNSVETDPALYGFTNVTNECVGQPSCAGYLFWNAVHPTAYAQQLIAEYAAQSLLGLESLTVPARLNSDAAQTFTSILNGRLNALQNGVSGVSYGMEGMQANSPDPRHKLSLFLSVGGQFGTQHTDEDNFALGYSYSSVVTAIGVDYRWNEHFITGLALGYNDSHANVKTTGGKVDDHGVDVGLYALATAGDAYAKFTGGYDQDNDKTSRTGVIDEITSKPKGQTWSLSTDVGLNFHPGANVILGPDFGLAYTNSGLGAYTESGDPLLTQTVDAQNFQQLIGGVGLHSAASLDLNGFNLTPYASAAAEFRMSAQSRHFSSYYADMPGVMLTNTYPVTAGHWALFSAGLNARLGPRLNANVNLATTAFKSDGNNTQANLNLSWKF